MNNDINIKTEYKEEIKLDHSKENIHDEDKSHFLYDIFWRDNKFKSLRNWPTITLVKSQHDLDNYFKIELSWVDLPHSEISLNLNNKKTYTFNKSFNNYKFIAINSKDAKIKWEDLYKINVGSFVASDSNIILLNRTRMINITHSSPTNKHLLKENEIIKFESINQITILNKDPSNKDTNLKHNIVSFYPNILSKHGLWTTVGKIEIKNDESVGRIYSNQISNLSISNLIFGNTTENMDLILNKNDESYNLDIDGFTKYDYKREGTFKEPSIGGKKGYYIPYNFKGEFYPSINISINNYFKDFEIIVPHYYEKPMLDKDDGIVTMSITENFEPIDSSIATDSVTVGDEDFNTIINEDLSIDGIKNLE